MFKLIYKGTDFTLKIFNLLKFCVMIFHTFLYSKVGTLKSSVRTLMRLGKHKQKHMKSFQQQHQQGGQSSSDAAEQYEPLIQQHRSSSMSSLSSNDSAASVTPSVPTKRCSIVILFLYGRG